MRVYKEKNIWVIGGHLVKYLNDSGQDSFENFIVVSCIGIFVNGQCIAKVQTLGNK